MNSGFVLEVHALQVFHYYYLFIYFQLVLLFRPDITVMVDWALKINYLSIVILDGLLDLKQSINQSINQIICYYYYVMILLLLFLLLL